ncbi:MAG TPA: malto-oligosyltrehalose trehalohydrolase [Gemmataceae bacterium]|nr:malto-oligosyltrehalose trehalohydrolase [Gemmataceae bacterium]
MALPRRLPVGAEILEERGVHFRVWAPKRQKVEVILEGSAAKSVQLEPEPGGYFSGFAVGVGTGARYRFRLDGEHNLYPDPASRYQPEGPHGPSQVIDPHTFTWTDKGWHGHDLKGKIVYEMHVGTFTWEGTWAAAIEQLPELANIGITCIEVMPVADFAGSFGWGYDGVNLFAPTRLYGTPDDFRHFINRAHKLNLSVILDVVYNHFGPDGNYITQFADDYLAKKATDWGDAINFDGPNSGPVREFYVTNARYWIEEFHLDGLRLDATQQIFDTSTPHILAEISKAVRIAGKNRKTFIVAENEPQEVRLIRPYEQGGYGIDALWNDDFHHSAMVALTGRNEAYYTDYLGNPEEFIAAVKWGYLYQGQRYRWQKKRRGTPALDIAPAHFVNFLQNHDQIANSGRGVRCHLLSSPGRYKAMTALLLLAPSTPMLFQGQEFAASAPFHFFAEHHTELNKLVHAGRIEFMKQFASLTSPESKDLIPNPSNPQTFRRCKLNFSERQKHPSDYALHRDLLRLRREDPAFQSQTHRGVDGAVLADGAFVLRFFVEHDADRLLIVNLGRDRDLDPAPQPLLAPPENSEWHLLWSSESTAYGGNGALEPELDGQWHIPGESAWVLKPRKRAVKEEGHG